jgi:CheY-like chemotaxis protein
MNSVSASSVRRVALLGFGDFERSALVSYLRLTGSRVPSYEEAASLAGADYAIADADHAGTLDAVIGADRVADTVFIGSLAPEGALAWMMRPIDPMQVFREIDATVGLRHSQALSAQAPAPRTAEPPMPEPAADNVPAAEAAAPPAAEAAAPPAAEAAAPPATEAAAPPATEAAAPPATEAAAPAAAAAPALPAAAPPGAPAAAGRGSPRRAGDTRPPTAALLVDDSEIALRYLERQLQALGLRTETATTSERALELLAQHRYDLVFLDVDLGPHSDLDGLALCQQIKGQHRQQAKAGTPLVVMVTVHSGATDRVRGSFAGCDAYLAKPLEDDTLRRSLRKLGVRMSAPADGGFGNSRPGSLSSRS